MKKIILSFVISFVSIISFISCRPVHNQSAKNDSDSIVIDKVDKEYLEYLASLDQYNTPETDSIIKAQRLKDSIRLDSINKLKKSYENKFTFKKDEFSDKVWVEPKSCPKYRNRNGIYCYFAMENNKPTDNFRFVFQYYAEDWLFIRNIIFNIDGENFTIYPNMETDCGGGYIWEWFDENYSNNLDLIKKIGNGKSVKMKLNGSQYYNIKTLTKQQIKDIKDMYDYYMMLKN